MNDSKNINDLKPEESWLKAEKMLDRHFKRKRVIKWSFILLSLGFLLAGSFVALNYFTSENASMKGNFVLEKTSDLQTVQPVASVPAAGNKMNDVGNSANNNKKNHINRIVNKENLPLKKSRSVDSKPRQKNAEYKPVAKKNNSLPGNKIEEKTRGTSEAKSVQASGLAGNSTSGTSSPEKKELEVEVGLTSGPETFSIQGNDQRNQKENEISEKQINSLKLMFIDPIKITGLEFEKAEDHSLSMKHREEIPLPAASQKIDLKISIYGSAQYVSKHLSSVVFNSYVTRRNNEESPIVTSSMGAALSAEMKNFTITGGIEYSSWGEKNNYTSYLVKKNVIENGSFHIYYRTITDTNYIFGNQYLHQYQVQDSTFNSHTDTTIINAFDPRVSAMNGVNKFYFIEVPIEFSYRFTHSRIGVGASVGISPAWLVREQGHYLTRNLDGVERIEEIKSLNQFIVNGRFSLDLYYLLNDKINLMARPQFKANLNSIFKSEYDVNQRYYSTGLVVGLQYYFR